MTKVATDSSANGLIKAVVADFSTSEGRSAAHDGLKADFPGGKPADMKTKSVEELRQVSALLTPPMPPPSRYGFARPVKAPRKQRPKAAAFSAPASK